MNHVRKKRQILRRLANPHGQTQAEILQHEALGHPLRVRAKGNRTPKNSGAGTSIAEILRAYTFHHPANSPTAIAARRIIAQVGSRRPKDLRPGQVQDIDQSLAASGFEQVTKSNYASATRQLLRWMWENHGAPKLDEQIRRYPGVRPRNVTATKDEIEAIMSAAPPDLRFWLLLCSDLALRSGTAARMSPENFNPETGELHLTTKANAKLTLPVTEEIGDLIDLCDQHDDRSFVLQLRTRYRPHAQVSPDAKQVDPNTLRIRFARLRRKIGITRSLTAHDLRRTAAVGMLEQTHDLRDVQALLGHRNLHSTLWYLDHDLRPVSRATLELIKRPPGQERKLA